MRRERPGPEQTQRLSRLKIWRTSIGANLSLDPSLLWPAASLERLAMAPETFGIEITSADVRHWQRDHFAALLYAFVKSMP